MKSRLLTVSITIAFAIPMLTFGQGFSFGSSSSSSQRSALLANLKYGQIETGQDSIVFDYEKSPGKAFLLSAIVPGAGEFYAGAKWRALIFAGIEVTSWVMHSKFQNKGDDLEEKYMRYANDNWDLGDWLEACLANDCNMLENSHHIWVEYEGKEYIVNDSLSIKFPEYISLAQNGDMRSVETREYYENIGKYDQFSGGWKDFGDYNSEPDTIYMSPIRDSYLTKRLNSNNALEMATNFVSVIMFNHLISAFDAIIAAKNYSSEEKKYSWNLGLINDYRYRNPLRGVRLSVAF